ncbi:hypothetical protein QBC33DRAFT_484011 [Phialemonium atrogriseum]|uniref:Uncharacterized protein n=1 Tax=Phialemonium atrogriseum TaxID=1093897 RepID=A0AAJ0CCH3_9PEZI|nr:uncharacterized protein QBC33DRAFT_484011 [Phialemonium atrogriseum]KAK1772747.1 hypothetical protein QBC33DRAFT_484011 [Phialemonium atrogriseum]
MPLQGSQWGIPAILVWTPASFVRHHWLSGSVALAARAVPARILCIPGTYPKLGGGLQHPKKQSVVAHWYWHWQLGGALGLYAVELPLLLFLLHNRHNLRAQSVSRPKLRALGTCRDALTVCWVDRYTSCFAEKERKDTTSHSRTLPRPFPSRALSLHRFWTDSLAPAAWLPGRSLH